MKTDPARSFWNAKCVIITGASSGIGQALAEHVSCRGAAVGLIARRAPLLDALAEKITSSGGRAIGVPADVRDLESVRDAVAAIESRLGPCDVLIASAGIYRQTDGRRFDAASAADVTATNLQGVIHAVGAVLPGMLTRGRGHVAAVSSIAGLIGLPAAGAYSASKAAVTTLLESLQLDLRRTAIKVTTVGPGYVDTAMVTDEERATLKHLVPVDEAARRIARAIERGRSQCWFPWQTWLPARLASLLPSRLYQAFASMLPEMAEAKLTANTDLDASGPSSRGEPQADDPGEDQPDTDQSRGAR